MEILTVEDIINAKEFKKSNGGTVTGKQYLDDAIMAFGLNPCDYFTAFQLLVWISKGNEPNAIVADIKTFWNNLALKYSK